MLSSLPTFSLVSAANISKFKDVSIGLNSLDQISSDLA